MNNKSYFIFLIVVCSTTTAFYYNYRDKFPLFLKDFLKDQKAITKVILLLCYKIDNSIKIAKDMDAFFQFGNISKIDYLKVYKEKNTLLIVTDLNCAGSLKYLEEKLDPQMFDHSLRWLILNKRNVNLVPNINAFMESNVFLVKILGYDDYLNVDQFYKINKTSSAIIEHYGNWSQSTGLIVTQTENILSRRRQNLQGSIFRVNSVIANNDSYNKLIELQNTQMDLTKIDLISAIDFATKSTLILILHLLDALNATMEFKPMKSWGYKNLETNEWDGVTKNLIEKKTDIGSSLLITKDRFPYIDYLSMVTPIKIQFILREPPLSYVANIYSLPFTSIVWTCSLGLVVLALTVILLTMKFQVITEKDLELWKVPFEVSDLLLSGISAICQMGILIDPKISSARIAAFLLLTTLVFLFTSYTANIVALLQSTTKSIKTLDNILEAGIELGVEDMVHNRYYFDTTAESIKKAMFPKSNGVPQYLNASVGMEKVRNEAYAFYMDLPNAYRIIEETYFENEKCNLINIKFFEMENAWFAVPKNSPYKEIMKILLFRIREYGFQHKMISKFGTKKPVCSGSTSFGSVRLNDCYAAFKILMAGYGIAVLILSLEKYFISRLSNILKFIKLKLSFW